jgi:hypothetical protein
VEGRQREEGVQKCGSGEAGRRRHGNGGELRQGEAVGEIKVIGGIGKMVHGIAGERN